MKVYCDQYMFELFTAITITSR